MFNDLADISQIVQHVSAFKRGDLDEVVVKQRHQRKRRLRAVNRSSVTVFVENWEEPGVIEMRVADHHCIKLIQIYISPVKPRISVPRLLNARMDAAVEENFALRGRDQNA